jgi:MFS family permease
VFALGGRLADVVGHRTMVVVGTLVFIGSSVACGLTPEGSYAAEWIVGFRIVQGAGAALMFPAALAVVLSAYPIERRGSAVARFFSAAGGLTAVGPFVGSYLVEFSWRWIFFINVPVALVGLVLTFVARVGNQRRAEPVDLVGAALIAVGAGAVVTGLQQSSAWGWSDLKTLACLVGGIVVLGIFVEVERVRPDPLIRVQFFEDRTFRAQNIILFFASVAFVPVFFFASVYAQVSLGWPPWQTGLYLLTFYAGFAPGVMIAGRWLDRGQARRAAIWGGALGAAGFFAWAARIPGLTESTQWPWIVLAGFGLGMIISTSNTDAINQVPSEHFGEATGVTQTVRNLGAAVGLAVLGTVLSTTLRHRVEDSLATFGVPRAKADAVVDALHGSGNAAASKAFLAQAGPKADQILQVVRLDFADASQRAFIGLGIAMLVVMVTAIVGLTKGHHRPVATADVAPESVDP